MNRSFALLVLFAGVLLCGRVLAADTDNDFNYTIYDSEDTAAEAYEPAKRLSDVSRQNSNLSQADDNGQDGAESPIDAVVTGRKMPDEKEVEIDTNATTARANYIQKVPSKKSADFNWTTSDYFDSIPDSKWLASIFDLHDWSEATLPAENRLSLSCTLSMRKYIWSLKNGSVWAVKMNDASGRYASQFFFGNDFWLGSRTFCRELHRKDFNPTAPPFKVHFYVAKFLVKLSKLYAIPMDNRVMTVGLCLPNDCSTEDVKAMLTESTTNKSSTQLSRTVNIIKVRAVPGNYSLWDDKKLHLLFTILGVVTALMIIGTVYELSLERRRSKYARKHSMICNNNDGDVKMVSNLPIDKVLNEKYELNNSNNDISAESRLSDIGNSVFSQLVLSFSALSNSRKILNCGPAPKDSLTCIHGLRFLSLSWVIMVHTYLQVFTVAENKTIRTLAERNFMFQTVSNATFSVDSFFFISGCLVAYLYFKSARKDDSESLRRPVRQKNDSCLMNFGQFFKLVGYRFLRLTPAYMFVLLIAEISMRWLHSISVFEPISQNHISCDKYWWRNILYINSLFEMKDMCMLWSWYVSNDTQFYVIGVIILLFSIKHFRFAAGLLITFVLTSWIVTIAIAIHVDYRARIEDPFANFDELYDKPWTRLGPYLVGMFVGWFLFKIKFKLSLSKVSILVGWFLALGTLFSLVYGLHVFPLELIGSALYVSVGHTAWGIALGWIVVACCCGHGGFINSFLSCPLLQPLSRLTYCAYLVHPIIMTVTNFQMGSPLHLQDAIVVILYLGNLTSSFIASFGISMLFEAPVVRLLKIIFSPRSKRSVQDQTSL